MVDCHEGHRRGRPAFPAAVNTNTQGVIPAVRQLFIAAMFVNAALLFAVQPMFARIALPLLGGAPAVWNTAMVFFQAALLLGYAYAWALGRRLPLKAQAAVHLTLLAAAFLALPLAVPASWVPPVDANPIPWLLALLAATVGPPFFALAANATLLQRWFSLTGEADAKDPYFLYAASNLGSVVALVAYPFAIEPLLGLAQQGQAWRTGYGALVLLLVAAGWRAARARAASAKVADETPAAAPPIAWPSRLRWAALAFVPSSLLLGVTTHISSEVTVAPLLWVAPLALYLLTFVNAFARRPWITHRIAVVLQAWTIIVLAVAFFMRLETIALVFVIHLAAFFFVALVCHGELAAGRPPAGRLAEFYLWLAAGGALGGAFNALVAPLVFSSVLEYPIMLAIACVLRPAARQADGPGERAKDMLFPAALAVLMIAASGLIAWGGWPVGVAALSLGAAAAWTARRRPVRFALFVAALLVFGAAATWRNTDVVETKRTFFGVHKVIQDKALDAYRLVHGVTVHGTQLRAPAMWRTPTDYYAVEGPLGQFFDVLRRDGAPKRVALVGLGAGASLCYRRPGDHWRVFEIDPAVVAIARDARFFHFVSECGAGVRVTLGDARLSLARPGQGPFDVIILDAFTSDAIPAHLLTGQAMALYRRLLKPGGAVLLNISNRYMRLGPVAAAAFASAGLAALDQTHEPGPRTAGKRSHWVAAAVDAARLASLTAGGRWRTMQPAGRPWTDDYWNILGAIRWLGPPALDDWR